MPDITKYLLRITSEHNDKPKFVAFVKALLTPLIDMQEFFQQLLTTFDVDTAIGVQLDAVGLWVGRNRFVSVPLPGVFFSLDTLGLGFDQGYWKGPFDPDSGLAALDDETYRALIKAKIIMNSWDGTIAVAAKALEKLFNNDPNTFITIQDNQDMTMTVAISGQVPGVVLISLLQNGEFALAPEGVGVNYIITSVNTAPVFGMDVENSAVSGFDVGAWGGVPGIGPGVVSGFSLVTVTASTATFSWVGPSSGVGPFTYQLQYHLGSAQSSTWVLAGNPVSTTQATASGLSANTTYTFSVYAVNSSGSGLPSAPIVITTGGGLPAQVTGLQATGSTSNSVNLSWNTVVGNGITYQVQFRQSNTTATFGNFNGTTTNTNQVVTGLATATAYDFQVFAQNSSGSGPPSAILTAGTSGSAPGAVQNLAITSTGQTDVALSWGQPTTNNGPYQYTVQFAQNINPITYQNFSGTIVSTAAGGTCDVTGLQPAQSYLFRVSATNQVGTGPASTPVSTTTLAGTLGAPANILVASIAATSASLSWSSVTGAVSYQMQQTNLSNPNGWTNSGPTVSSTSTTVTGLQSGFTYLFRVYGIDSLGNHGQPSPIATLTTTGVAPGQVTGLAASGATNTSMVLQWNIPSTGNLPFVYQVQFKQHAATAWTNFGAPVSILNTTVTNLQIGQSYDFEVYALNNFGTGTPSTTATASTTGATGVAVTWNPSDITSNLILSQSNLRATAFTPPVSSPAETSVGTNSISLSWNPANPNGFFGVRGGISVATGKVYLEYTVQFASKDFAVGIANSSWPMASAGLGTDANGLGFFVSTQRAIINGTAVLTSTTASADVNGDTISCAFDFNNKLFWFTSQAMRSTTGQGAWNNSAVANPATGAGGISMSGLAVGSYFPAFGDLEASSGCAINGGSSPFVISIPTGFLAWSPSSSVTPPGQVSGLLAGTATASAVPLSWSVPVGGSAVDFYHIQYRKSGTAQWFLGPVVTQTGGVVQNLLPATSFNFQVYASNAAGVGPLSNSLSASTAASTAVLSYRGLNIEGSDLTKISTIPTSFPHVNAVVIPVFLSTANQTSTDVAVTVNLTTVGGWIDAANTAGLEAFLGVYLLPRDGSPGSTITPSDVAAFMTNLQSVCVQVAQLGAQHGALGMWCVGVQPWGGTATADSGPWSAVHAAQWQSLYLACKTAWPSGMVAYAALQTTLGFNLPGSSWAVPWAAWDAVVLNFFPGSNNTYTTASQFQTFFDTQADPDVATDAAVGTQPLITALINYSNSIGARLIVNQCGIIPADGNQILPGQANVLPPPFDLAMQSAWFQAIMNEVTNHIANFAGFFVWDGGANGFNSPYSGIDYWGIQGSVAATSVDGAYANLVGTTTTLVAPTGVVGTPATTTIAVTWNAVTGSNITYVVQWTLDGANTWTSLPAVTVTSATISGLTAATTYDIRVYAQQGSVVGPTSVAVVVTTTGTQVKSITITDPGSVAANTSFTVSGTLTGYATAPTLTYFDDPVLAAVPNITDTVTSTSISLSWGSVSDPPLLSFPTGSNVGVSAFSFQHPGLPAGSHKLEVTDGTINNSITFTVSSGSTQSVTVSPITTATQGASFTVSGTLAGFSSPPSMNYSDDGSSTKTVISGNTSTTFSFTHASMATAGNHSITVTAGTVSSTINYTVAAGAQSQSITINPIAAAVNSTFLVFGNLSGFGVAPSLVYLDDGSSATNPVPSSSTFSSSYSFTHPAISTTGTHTIAIQVSGNAAVVTTQTFVVTSGPTLTIDPIGTVVDQSNFNLLGAISGFTTAPSLVYSDDGGTNHVVTNNSAQLWAVNHPPVSVGNHSFTIAVSGNASVSKTATYTCIAQYTPGPVTNIVANAIHGSSIDLQWSPPDNNQTYTYTVAWGTTGLSGPFTNTMSAFVSIATVTGLVFNTNYYFEIFANTSGGIVGTPATAGPFKTAAGDPPGPVVELYATGDITNGLTVNWLPVTAATGYTVFSATSNAGPFSPAGTSSTTSLQVTSLQSSTNYYFYATANNAFGTSGISKVIGPFQTRVPPVATLNPSDVSSNLVLSNNNLTVTSSGTTAGSVRSTTAQNLISAGNPRVYFEVTVSAATEHWGIGLVGDMWNLGDKYGLGQSVPEPSVTSIGFYPVSSYEPGRIYWNDLSSTSDALVGAGATNTVTNDVIGVALDVSAGKIWFTSPAMRTDGNVWNNLPLAQANPAAFNTLTQTIGIGGFFLRNLLPAPWFAAFQTRDNAAQAKFNFAGPFINTMPTGYTSWQSPSIAVTAPLVSIAPPPAMNAGIPTASTIPLSWTAPPGGPFTYRVQRMPFNSSVDGFDWLDAGTFPGTSGTVTVPSSTTTQVGYFTFRVQAINSSGQGGQWSLPYSFWELGTGNSLNFSNSPSFFPASTTSTSITFNIQPSAQPGGTLTYLIDYMPMFRNGYYNQRQAGVAPFITFGTISASSTTFTITGLTAATQYDVRVWLQVNGVTQIGNAFLVSTTPAVGGTVLKIHSPSGGWLQIPSGAEYIQWAGEFFVVKAAGTTTHCAIHYDLNYYDGTSGPSLASAVSSVCESVYSQCQTWFGVSDPGHTATIETSQNPTGSLVNVFLTGANFGGAHLTCLNADIMIGASPTDLGSADVAKMILVAELTEVFMPSLQSLPDCDQHVLGEGLSLAMAFSLYPNGILVGATVLNCAAYWMNTKVLTDGSASASGTSRGDWLNTNVQGEGQNQIAGIGCNALFFGYLTSQLGYTYTQICSALAVLPANATARQLYNHLANNSTDPFPAFVALINGTYPTTTLVDSIHFTNNPFPL